MIAVIDLGISNLGSVVNMLKRVGAEPRVVTSPRDLESAKKIVLPGVGAFNTGAQRLRSLDLVPALHEEVVKRGKPFLGICLGMQLLCEESEEGHAEKERGLGWVPGRIRKFLPATGIKIPHMGWNQTQSLGAHPLFKDLERSRFYFVHSYHMECEDNQVLAQTEYGDRFTSAVAFENIMGVQFHPEKSHRNGLKLIENFVKEVGVTE